MRKAFAETLAEIARTDNRIFLLTADLGYMALEPYSNEHPDRFLNVGVAEQNMIGVATGLAMDGFIPYCYSISNFSVMRPFEFIRNGPVAHRLPVRIVGVGAGFEYSTNGLTHYGLEDVALMRSQSVPVIAPCDCAQARQLIRSTYKMDGPTYIRLGKNDSLVIPELASQLPSDVQNPALLREGDEDIALVCMGTATEDTLQAARSLANKGINPYVYAVSFVNDQPIGIPFGNYQDVFVIEHHYINGGLGSQICELVAERGHGCFVHRIGVESIPDGRTGTHDFMKNIHGISVDCIVSKVLEYC